MAVDYTIDRTNAEQDAWVFPATVSDPVAYASEVSARVTAKYFAQPVLEEVLALIYSRTASKTYSKLWTCLAGLNVGDPVYISATDTVTLADATTSATAKVVGFVRSKPSTTTCYIEHFMIKTGLAGLTAGNDVYLSDAGGYAAAAGTVTRRLGIAIDTDEALLFSSALYRYGIEEIIEDTTPQLGGTLDGNNQTINNVASLIIGASALAGASSKFEIQEDTNPAIFRQFTANDTAAYGAMHYLQRARGTNAARTATQNNDAIGLWYGAGYSGAAFGVSGMVGVYADGNHSAGSTPGKLTFWTTPDAAVAANERMTIDKDGNVGIGELDPGTLLDLASTAPYITLHNTTEEDADGGRESKLIFEGEQSGGELTTLGELEFSHDGAVDDEKGKFVLRLNDGNDGAAPTATFQVSSDGSVAGHFWTVNSNPLLENSTNLQYFRLINTGGLVNLMVESSTGGFFSGTIAYSTILSSAVAFHNVVNGSVRTTVLGDGKFGLGEVTPGTLFDMAGTAPYMTIHNTTEEDGAGGRECKLIFEGEQSGGELSTLGEFEFCHDGAADDEKGKFILRLNDGNDGASPTTVMTVLSDKSVAFPGDLKLGANGVRVFVQDAAPTADAADDTWYETDTNIDWFWNGTYWLSKTLYTASAGFSTSISANSSFFITPTEWDQAAQHDVFVVDLTSTLWPSTTTDGSNYWTLSLMRRSSANVDTSMGSHNTSGATASTWLVSKTQIDGYLDLSGTDAKQFVLDFTKTGSPPSVIGSAAITYRWVHL